MAGFTEGAFKIHSGAEYCMEFTPQSRWDCEISVKYREGARGVLRLSVRFDSTETSMDISVRDSNGAVVIPDELRAEGCGQESLPDGVRFCELSGMPRIKGEISCVVPQGTYYIGFCHGSRAGAEGLGEMIFSVSVKNI
ncbi:MAG: hypothetical protein K2G32_00775 [Oscillospiraceae bacterium]|nr:hypothetical protein [Oscillospiraceae bacterium]